MSQEKRTRIKIVELPLRARNLSSDELLNVFGGCIRDDSPCASDNSCCTGNCAPPYRGFPWPHRCQAKFSVSTVSLGLGLSWSAVPGGSLCNSDANGCRENCTPFHFRGNHSLICWCRSPALFVAVWDLEEEYESRKTNTNQDHWASIARA